MSKTDIGPKIGIDGEAEFRQQLRQIDTGLKTLGSEMQLVTSEFIGNERSVEALTAQNQVLERTTYSLSEKLDLQRQRLRETAEAYGEADARTQKLQQAVNKTETELNKTTAAIQKNNAAMDELAESESEAAEKGKSLANILGEAGITGKSFAAAGAVAAFGAAVKELTDFLVDSVKSGAEYADNILTLSTNYGIATDTLQEYQYMAELTDVSLDTITGSISKLVKSMSAARKGSGDAADAFAALGINILDSNGQLRDSEEVFDLVIQRLGYIGNETERDALSMAIFGKSAQELNSLIAVGADGLAAYREEARAAGYVLDQDALQALGRMDDQFQRVDKTIDAIKNQIAAEFAPEIIDLTQKALDFAQSVDWSEVGKVAVGTLKVIGKAIELLLAPITNVIDSIENVVDGVRKAKETVDWLFGKTGSGASIDALPSLADPLPSSPSYPASAQTGAGAWRVTPYDMDTQIAMTVEIDGEALAHKMYRLNQQEAARRGSSAIN